MYSLAGHGWYKEEKAIAWFPEATNWDSKWTASWHEIKSY